MVHISTEGLSGYPVQKSMAVGSVLEALPYLSRRAQENSALTSNTRQERQLLQAELARRIKRRVLKRD